MKLNEIRDNKGATRDAMRVGRGIGTGKGKTAGRGMKGQKSRSGVSIKGFEGGQMPIYQRLPKRGFNSLSRKKWVVINLGRIQTASDEGRIDLSKDITRQELQLSGLVSNREGNLRLLAKGELKAKLNITVTAASKSAIALVEKAGGKVTLLESTPPVKVTKEATTKKVKKAKPASATPVKAETVKTEAVKTADATPAKKTLSKTETAKTETAKTETAKTETAKTEKRNCKNGEKRNSNKANHKKTSDKKTSDNKTSDNKGNNQKANNKKVDD